MVAAFERILGRSPSASSSSECETGLQRLTGVLRIRARPTPPIGPGIPRRSALVHVLLNHNDFVTIR